MYVKDFLRQYQREDMPAWLREIRPGDRFPREAFFGSRVVFCPGHHYTDTPVETFGYTCSAHCFVYADYDVPRDELESELSGHPQWPATFKTYLFGFLRGYHTVARIELDKRELIPRGWTPHLHPDELPLDYPDYFHGFWARNTAPYAFLEVRERGPRCREPGAPRRLAILFLGADGVAAYDALFCQGYDHPPPYAAHISDRTGNYTTFGRGGLLERIAIRSGVFPEWLLLSGDSSLAWDGYEHLPGVTAGGSAPLLRDRCAPQAGRGLRFRP